MNEITMIPVGLLEHHPENPRLDLGDLTELTASIKKNGIMQNLTVVPGMENNKYLVVIGNRRLEAAKAAGLIELPCVVRDLDHKEQIATMLEENMHRTDLTLFEQAQGVQMMMDLGLTETEISEMTGFSRTTIKRRAEMAKLDKETLKEKCKQLTMDEMDQLMKIRDLDKRNELLKDAGTGNFNWNVEREIKEQNRAENYQLIRGILLQAGCVERNIRGIDDFWNKYEFLPYSQGVDLDSYKAGKNVLPEDDRQLYFYREYSYVKFFAEKRKPGTVEAGEEPDDEETAERKEKEQEAADAWARLKEIEEHAKESRAKFIETLTVKQKDTRKALEWLIIALVASNSCETAMCQLLPDYDDEQMQSLPEGHTETDLDLKWIWGEINDNPGIYAELMDRLFFDGEDCIRYRWNTREKPEYCRNVSMITGYEWLEDFGYQTSDDERDYLDGTLDCFKEVAEE